MPSHSHRLFPLLLVLVGLAARADCVDGARVLPPGESAFGHRVLTAVAAAMPPAPKGWEVAGQSQTDPSRFACSEPAGQPAYFTYSIAYRRSAGMAERQAKVEAAFELSLKPDPKRKEELDKLEAKQQKLADAANKAATRGDTAALEKLQGELDEVSDRLARIYDTMESAYRSQARKSLQDVEAFVHIYVNSDYQRIEGAEKVPAGVTAYRIGGNGDYEDGRWHNGGTHLFLGRWKRVHGEDGDSLHAQFRATQQPSAQTIEVVVEAERHRAEQLIKGLDLHALEKLVGQ